MDQTPTPPYPEDPDDRDQPPISEEPDVPPGPDPDPGFYPRALHRMPRWMALIAVAALPFAWHHGGALWAASFLAGAIGGYWNYVAVCRVADRLTQTGAPPRSTPRLIIRLLFIGVAAFVIIRFTRIRLVAAFLGLFTPGAAVVVEILYELVSYAASGKRASRQI